MNTTVFKIVLDTNIFIAIIGKQSPYQMNFRQDY
jgi:predicted nucleic acid-binding protein